jgi:hypothetical protein
MAEQTNPVGHVPTKLRLGRGLFRLWAVLSLLWIVGISTVYWPGARAFYWPPSAEPARSMIFNYETATLDIIPVVLPLGQEGIRWENLSAAEQNAADYFVTHDEPTTKLGYYEKMLWEADNNTDSDHEQFRFKLVPLTSLGPAEVQNFRREWAEPRWRMFCEESRALIALALGVPLAAGLFGFLAHRAGRWIWAGFAGLG